MTTSIPLPIQLGCDYLLQPNYYNKSLYKRQEPAQNCLYGLLFSSLPTGKTALVFSLDIDCARDNPSLDKGGDVVVGNLYNTLPADGVAGASGDMGGDQHIGIFPKAVFSGKGFRVGDIQPGSADFFGVQRLAEGLGVDSGPPPDVDDQDAILAAGEGVGIENLAGFGGVGKGEDQSIGLGQDLFQLVHRRHPVKTGQIGGGSALDTNGMGTQQLGFFGVASSQIAGAQADHCASGQLAHLAEHLPSALRHGVSILAELLEQVEVHANGELGDDLAVGAAGIGQNDLTGVVGVVDVDVYAGRTELQQLEVGELFYERNWRIADDAVKPGEFGRGGQVIKEVDLLAGMGCLQPLHLSGAEGTKRRDNSSLKHGEHFLSNGAGVRQL